MPTTPAPTRTSTRTAPDTDEVAQVRAFNRFYTRSIGVLQDSLVGSPFSLGEARVLHELARRESDSEATAQGMEGTELRRLLDLDAGYFSRVLARFDAAGLIRREPHPSDARRQLIQLTEAGRAGFADLDERQVAAVRRLLEPLSPAQRATLTEAMATIERVLGGPRRHRGFVLRPPELGDLGWIVARHGELYAQEYDRDPRFEAMVARIVADYAQQHDPATEAVWIAEVDGQPVGSIACMADAQSGADPGTARLRLLLVEPTARGMGIGERLVAECLRFARRAGYTRMTLWTTSSLDSARRIYQRAGFTLDNEAPHDGFGHGVIGQNWSRPL
jgi:DNA-binding MarR family transcriptional regulator/GNAT superfamily N-acetyltransferase